MVLLGPCEMKEPVILSQLLPAPFLRQANTRELLGDNDTIPTRIQLLAQAAGVTPVRSRGSSRAQVTNGIL